MVEGKVGEKLALLAGGIAWKPVVVEGRIEPLRSWT